MTSIIVAILLGIAISGVVIFALRSRTREPVIDGAPVEPLEDRAEAAAALEGVKARSEADRSDLAEAIKIEDKRKRMERLAEIANRDRGRK